MSAISDQRSAIRGERSAVSAPGNPPSAFCILPSGGRRRAFTLVELLVVITILAILASLLLFALAGAQTTAIEMRTRSTIAKLNAIIMQKYESYRTRRLAVTAHPDPYVDANSNGVYDAGETFTDLNGTGAYVDRTMVAKYRLDALRDLMRLEMPDSFNDVQDDPITKPIIGSTSSTVILRPAANVAYKAALDAANNRDATEYKNTKLQQAMCLYLIVSKGCDDPDVMEQFAPYEVKTDPLLGLSYFVDGWGNPIFFLRWAPAYVSPLQPATPTQRDPFDPLNADANPPTFPLFPLIYSPGPDGNGLDGGFGITASLNDGSGNPFHYGNTTVNNGPFYNTAPLTIKTTIGLINDPAAASNNITNHDIETR